MRVGILLVPIAVFVLGDMAFLPLVQAGDGNRLFLTSPGGAGRSAHYAPLRDLSLDRRSGYAKHYSLDRRSGYGQPSRILGTPLDVGETPFERLGRNAEQNEVDVRSRPSGPEAASRPNDPYDPSRPPSAQTIANAKWRSGVGNFRLGSCVTSIAGPNGAAQLYER